MLSKERQENLNQFVLSKMIFYIHPLTTENRKRTNNGRLSLDITRWLGAGGGQIRVRKWATKNAFCFQCQQLTT